MRGAASGAEARGRISSLLAITIFERRIIELA
jgi:hypothetical protein